MKLYSKVFNQNIVFTNSIFTVIQILTSAFSLLFLYRQITNVLGIQSLGIWSLISGIGVFASVGNSGINIILTKYTSQFKNPIKTDLYKTLNTIIVFNSLVLAMWVIIIYFLFVVIGQYFVDISSYQKILNLIPFYLFNFYINCFAQAIFSVIDGLNKAYIKNITLIVSNLLFAIIGYGLINKFGLLGIVLAQVVQVFVLFFSSLFYLSKEFSNYKLVFNFEKRFIKEVLLDTGNLQITSICQIIYEPITKFLLNKYLGLKDVAYYELSTRLVLQFRNIIVLSFQNIIPSISRIESQKEIIISYIKNINYCFVVSTYVFMPYIVIIPFFSIVMLGNIDNRFVFYSIVLGISWFINSCFCIPYFYNIAISKLSNNTISHIITALLSPILFYIFLLFLPEFTIIGVSLSSIIGTITFVVLFHRAIHLSIKRLFNYKLYILYGISVSLFSIFLSNFTYSIKDSSSIILLLLLLVLISFIYIIISLYILKIMFVQKILNRINLHLRWRLATIFLKISKTLFKNRIYKFKLNINGIKFDFYYPLASSVAATLIFDIFENDELSYITEKLKIGDTFFDIGANAGIFTILASKIVGNNGKVYSFEVGTEEIELFKKNIAANNINNVVLIEKAVSNKTGVATFFVSEDGALNSLAKNDHFLQKIIQERVVETICIDEFVAENKIEKIDGIKIDVEGAEKFVFEGALNTIGEKVSKFVLFEAQDSTSLAFGYDTPELLKYLMDIFDKKYYYFKIGGIEQIIKSDSKIDKDLTKYYNYLIDFT